MKRKKTWKWKKSRCAAPEIANVIETAFRHPKIENPHRQLCAKNGRRLRLSIQVDEWPKQNEEQYRLQRSNPRLKTVPVLVESPNVSFRV